VGDGQITGYRPEHVRFGPQHPGIGQRELRVEPCRVALRRERGAVNFQPF
jgi:hypothetical protein